MAISTKLRQKPTLKLTQKISPQHAQLMNLVQMPIFELKQEINRVINENPLLKENDDLDEQIINNSEEENSETQLDTDVIADIEIDSENGEIYKWEDENYESDDSIEDFDQGVEKANFNLRQISEKDKLNYQDFENNINITQKHQTNIYQNLLIEAKAKAKDKIQAEISQIIIGNLDEFGFFSEDLVKFRKYILKTTKLRPTILDLEYALELIQCLDPAGIGARDIRQCLLIQTERLPESKLKSDCLQILAKKSYYNLIINQKDSDLLTKLNWEKERIQDVYQQLGKFTTRPVSLLTQENFLPEYIEADVIVKKINHKWYVFNNDGYLNNLAIDSNIKKILNSKNIIKKQVNKNQDTNWLNYNYSSAKNFIRNLKSRSQLIWEIANYIVKYQRSFFELGDITIKPLLQKDLANHFDIHFSTISRVIAGKYMDTPRGMIPFSHFIVRGKISSDYGSQFSATSVVAMIRELIANENKSKPLSDRQITKILKNRGIEIVERTVAKYRLASKIESSYKRKINPKI